ncbi:MFS transporter [Citricoccus sp. GCM10030269]|uniref:MFS transporter n=1 Tax=Citricoccus sp. GCM10030269 TaxID=3273388 RepID=UPI00360DD6DE
MSSNSTLTTDDASRPSQHAGAPAPTPADQRRVLGASFAGTAIEWYDFFIYGSAAALIFGPQFFPSEDPITGTLSAFATFAVGFIARPIGGLLAGHFGDQIGRKKMLLITMLVMGGATVGIGLLPNFATIGIWAPILLVTLRFIQGLGVGGEWGGAVLMAVEYAPRNRRALFGAFPQMGLPVGIIVSNLVFITVTATLAPEAFQDWGWRVPFLLSALLIIMALYLRFRVEDSPVFQRTQEQEEVQRFPLGELLRHHGGSTLLAGLASAASPAIGYLYSVYMLAYGTEALGLPQPTMLWLIVGGAVIHLVTVILGALLADRFQQKPVFVIGAALVVVGAFPLFWLVDTAQPVLILLGFAIVLLAQSLMAGPQAALVAELFPANLRYSGASTAYQIGSIVGGGFAPLIATSLYAAFGASWPISLYVLALGVLALVTILPLRTGRFDASWESSR